MAMENRDSGQKDSSRNWPNIRVERKSDGYHVSLLDDDTRSQFADAVRRGGKEPLQLGSGPEKVFITFSDESGTREPQTTGRT